MAMALVSWMTPALAAVNAHWSLAGTRPRTDEMLMILPPPCLSMTRAAALLTRYTP